MKITPINFYNPYQSTNFKGASNTVSKDIVKLVEDGSVWGAHIQIDSKSDLLLQVLKDDFAQISHPMCIFSRLIGNDGLFPFSVVGTGRKIKIRVPAHELTDNMKMADKRVQTGTHPFLIDMAAFLNAHPEVIAEI